MAGLRNFALALCCAALVTATPETVSAQSSVCVQLEARLIALERGTGQGSVQDARAYDRAISKQQQEIDRATAEARRSRCYGGLFLQGSPAPKCGQLMSTIDRMKANLRRLMTDKSRNTGTANVSRERSDILRSMAAQGCTSSQARSRTAPVNGGGLFAALFGQARVRGLGEDTFFRGNGYGTYRTLCVRTCDGYYFPISFSTVQGQFPADAQTCQQMCPGTEVALYTYRNPGEEADAMVSLQGQPYTALPTAFRYRTEYDPSCKCGSPAATTLASLGTSFDVSRQRTAEPFVPIPTFRPARGEDPETAANRAGNYTPQRLPAEGDADAPDQIARNVRIVGPAFYYGQQSEVTELLPASRASLREDDSGDATVQ